MSPGRIPWPQKFRECDYIERSVSGPPFEFYDEDWTANHGLGPDMLHGLAMEGPDLPEESEGDVGPDSSEGREPDSTKGLGWRGAWVMTLLKKHDRKQPLGERTETVWSADNSWGVEVRFRALGLMEFEDPDDDELEIETASSRGISDYDIRAPSSRFS
ncbi:hypothetical protein DFH07DRAFT_955237 [Mycena maculata]|uniref:Uncharacterized protein n=1 Tax=Mycena maculata TaxID=230809 RepID=A0AAD7JK08_9AGAR|nr:hypothetical protein DFH07DRAFT_955237 [Mycena maculata]